MFCNECGKPVPEGSKFCLSCGTPLPVVPPTETPSPNVVPPAVTLPPNEPKPEKKGGGFFSSPAGIALVVILAVAVIAGITFGIIFLVKGNDNNTVDAETMRVWDEYESLLNDNSTNLPKITTDQAALTQAQADLKKTQDKVAALERVLKENGGTEARRVGNRRGTSVRDIKADQMAAALAAYRLYVQKMNELFTNLVGANLLDANVVNKLNQILADLQKLGANVRVVSKKFLADNKVVTTTQVDFPILTVAKTFQTDIQNNVNTAQQAEQQRLVNEKAAADQAAAAAAAQVAAQQQQQKQQQQQGRTTIASCPQCGASDPSVWMQTRSGYHCLSCGYIWHDPNAQ